MSDTPRAGSALASVMLVLVSGLIGSAMAEAGYRYYLHQTQPARFLPSLAKGEHPDVWYFQDSPWRYNEEFGYEYVPGVFDGGSIVDGKVMSCWDWHTNERGNIGRIKGSYEEADLKILVFGDSWTAQQRPAPDGTRMAWPNFLQDELEARTGKSVHVVNFGRDGTGLLHMFDLAKAMVPAYRPDLAVFAFITDDLTRDRFWRTKTFVDGRERIMVSLAPDPDPDWRTATDAAILNADATKDWCQALRKSQATGDPVVAVMERAVLLGRRQLTVLADPYTLTDSFLYDRVVHGDAFRHAFFAAKPSQNPRHKRTDFADDPRMVANVAALRATGIPIVLVHLAFYPELKDGREYIAGERELALAESLSRLTGQSIHETLDHVATPITNLEALSGAFPSDHHPSREGQKFYANMVATVLTRHGYLE